LCAFLCVCGAADGAGSCGQRAPYPDLTNAVGCAILDTKKRSNPMDFWGRGAYFGVKKLVVPKKKPKKKKTVGKTIFKKLF